MNLKQNLPKRLREKVVALVFVKSSFAHLQKRGPYLCIESFFGQIAHVHHFTHRQQRFEFDQVVCVMQQLQHFIQIMFSKLISRDTVIFVSPNFANGVCHLCSVNEIGVLAQVEELSQVHLAYQHRPALRLK